MAFIGRSKLSRRVLGGLLWGLTFVTPTPGPGPALACGVSTPDGSAACSLQEHEEATRPRWHVGVSTVYTSTALRFSDRLYTDETRGAAVVSVDYQPWQRTTLQAALGSTFGGHLTTPTGRYDFSPGPTAAFGASRRLVEGNLPFVVLTSKLSFSTATTRPGPNEAPGAHASYTAFDLRFGVMVGVTVLRVLHPYLVGRVFGGPVYWQYQGTGVVGGDRHHYQLGAGISAVLVQRISLFAEGVPLGERAIAGGLVLAL